MHSMTHAPNASVMTNAELKAHVRTVRDWPQPGVNFRDVTTLFENPDCFRSIIDSMVALSRSHQCNLVAGVDARGFILAGAVAYLARLPLALVRKKGKLPYETVEESYSLEYGEATIELHADTVKSPGTLILIDDLIATGGTLLAAGRLFQRLGVETIIYSAVIDLPELGGSARLRKEPGCQVHSLIEFSENE
jgi:adenine phosphoribosyltransferase